MVKLTNRNSRGFTILELMIGMAVFLIISGAILTGMGRLQASYRTAEISTQMQQQLRSTMELMAAEIGQAGLQASTVEGGATLGDAGVTSAYKMPAVSAGLASPVLSPNTGTCAVYVGQWLTVDGGANQEATQVEAANTTTCTITANFGIAHAANTPVSPMGVFPHGILSDQSVASTSGGKLAMFGEITGSGNGLWAVEYACPSAFPGPLTRTAWNLSTGAAATTYNLIDNVIVCYFCWPGVSSTVNPNCPTVAAGDQATLITPSGNVTYTMVTQVGFTITASENVTISGSTQPISITKSYSNVQPRNLITADKIYNVAVASVAASNNTLTLASALNGELQPDPPAIASVPW